MHSKIFHITPDPEATPVRDFDLPEGFVGEIADYVDTIHDPDMFEDSIKGLARRLGIEIKDNKFEVTDEMLDAYFTDHWVLFQNSVLSLYEGMTLKGFKGRAGVGVDSIAHMIWRVSNSYEDKFGFYVCDDDGYPETLDSWLRNFAKPNTTYYIKAVIDYHF